MNRGDEMILSIAFFDAHSVVTYDKAALKRFATELLGKSGLTLNVRQAAERALRW